MKIITIVGNPKPLSKTYHIAEQAAAALSNLLSLHSDEPIENEMIELAHIGTGLVQWDQQVIAPLVEKIDQASYIVVASPTYKASYTGLLKLFLDILPMKALQHKLVLPIMIGAGDSHRLAVEYQLKPVLSELGATFISQGLYMLESKAEHCEEELRQWLTSNELAVKAFL
ncbi:NAD(P)H-dependent oxidoreductase [Paenibacillus septentrionalis]|uniref:NAD(P)H-dependent oxidoreductase n=1 Tax=Paenibacillus septentrionalis TaxID=429342 RepID=A0ABW1V6Y6_9BACL